MTAQLVTDALADGDSGAAASRTRCCIIPTRAANTPASTSSACCADHGIACCMSRSGNCWDNAAMESFFSSLKTERTSPQTSIATRDDARADVFDYIERFYNPKRRHSTIGYLSPVAFE